MKKNFAAVLALSLMASSCSTYKVEKYDSAPTERTPGSSKDEPNLKTAFDMMINSEDPAGEMLGYLNRVKNIYLRAEATLAEFDRELDEGATIDNSKSYKKMIVMYELTHRLREKIVYHYLKLTDMAYDKTQNPERRKLAKEILHKFKANLDAGGPIEKFSFDDIKIDIVLALRERNGAKSKITAETPATSFKSDEEKLKMLRKYREQFKALGKREMDSNDEVTTQIESEAEKLKLVDDSGREPKSEVKFAPGIGGTGNVMGLVFPKGIWALTYDDGPSPVHTPQVLKNLEQLQIKATFFWLAQNVVANQTIVDSVKAKGMALANHSWSHLELPKQSAAVLQKEIVQSTQVETKAYGEPIRFFRCPYGAGNSVPRIRQMIADLGMIHVFWSVDTLDWQDKDPDSIVARAKKQMFPANHGVILFHDIHAQSVIASKKLVEWSKTLKGTESEIRWVTIPEIVDEMNGVTPINGAVK